MSSVVVPLRERRRAETIAEIKAVALRQLTEVGPQGLALRAVAREVGVSVQALYHYFESRDALITALITDACTSLAGEVASAARAAGGAADGSANVAAGLAYRRWAIEHPSAFLLVFGAPLPDYRAPSGGPTTEAARQMGAAFRAAVFDGWSAEELAGVPEPPDEVREALESMPAHLSFGLPAGALELFTEGWALLHGMVMLELLGQAPWLDGAGERLLQAALDRYDERIKTVRPVH